MKALTSDRRMAPSPPCGLRIVVVDDDAMQRTLARNHLEAAGFVVETYCGPTEALEALRESGAPDAILSDIVMDDVDGFAFCSMIRQEPALLRVPVVLVSASFDQTADHDLAREVGANALVLRSPSLGAAIDALRKSLEDGAPRSGIGSPPPMYVRRVASRLARFQRDSDTAAARYRVLFENATDICAMLTERGLVVEANRRLDELLGLEAGSAVGRSLGDFVPPGSAAESRGLLRVALAAGTKVTLPLRHASGATVFVEFTMRRTVIDGRVTVLAVGRDMTELRLAQLAIETSERRYRSLVERVPDVIFSTNAKGHIAFVGPNVRELCGFTAEELTHSLAEHPFTRIHPEERPSVVRKLHRLFAEGEPLDYEARWQHKDGHFVWIHCRALASRSDTGELSVDGIVSDITTRKNLEEQLCHAQKIEAVGSLSAGIAHDFNNILTVIIASAEFLSRDGLDDDSAEALNDIGSAARRAVALTSQLLAFSRRAGSVHVDLDVNEAVRNVRKLLARVVSKDIRLSCDLAPELPALHADPSQLDQVLMNLAVNARDSMQGSGELELSTRAVMLDGSTSFEQHRFRDPPPSAGRYVRISVRDTGSGMSEDTLAHIFEPFFTTKEERGTGLGLSTSYGIIRRHGGHLSVETAVGQGTTFSVFLPCVVTS